MKKLVAILLLLFASMAFGADRTWNNDNGTNVWNDADNWVEDAVPGAGDVAIFDGTSTDACLVDVNPTIDRLWVKGTYGASALNLNNKTFTLQFTGALPCLTVGRTMTQGGSEIFNCAGDVNVSSNHALAAGTTMNLTGTGEVVKVDNPSGLGTINIRGTYRVQTGVYAGAVNLGYAATTTSIDLDSLELQCSSFSRVAGTLETLDINGGTLDVDGACDLSGIVVDDTATGGQIECSGNFTIDATSTLDELVSVTLTGGASNVSVNVSDNQGDVTIDSSGTITAAAAQYWDSITMTLGTFDLAGYALDLDEGITGTAGTIDMDVSTVALSGTFNGANITVTGNAVGGLPATIEGGTIQNVDATMAHIDARGIDGSQPVDGGGNDNVRFARGLVGGGVF